MPGTDETVVDKSSTWQNIPNDFSLCTTDFFPFSNNLQSSPAYAHLYTYNRPHILIYPTVNIAHPFPNGRAAIRQQYRIDL